MFTGELLRMRAADEDIAVQFPIDERVLRPRVGAFIVVGGSLPFRWKTLAMPLMHSLTASAQIGVVDQVQFAGAGSPASIVLDAAALERAATAGRNVAHQLGRSFDEVEYKGDAGLCPLCHLDVVVFGPEGVECASCGAGGELRVVDGEARIVFTEEGLARSVISIAEKHDHFLEVQQTAAEHAPERARIAAAADSYRAWERLLLPQRG